MLSNNHLMKKNETIFTTPRGGSLDLVYVEGQTKKHRNDAGLGWLITGLVIVGDLAGGGIVALPNAVISAGPVMGFGMLILFGFMAAYTATQLGDSWAIMQERWPLYRKHQRQPYAEMGFKAGGNWLRLSITCVSNLSLFGTSVVLILLAAKNVSSFLSVFFDLQLSVCYTIILVAVILTPLTFFKSPKDFWPVIVCAMIATACAVVLIVIGTIWDSSTCKPVAKTSPSTLHGIFHAYGTLIFSYGGHGCFPTIVHDMRKPYHFRRTAFFAFTVTGAMYLLVSAIGYYVYGNSVGETVILSVQTVWVQQAINLVIAMHVFLSITIMINPINQEVEEYLQIPHDFGWQRVATRCGTIAAAVFVAESMPHFGPVLDLFGGSAMMLIMIVFPVLCYLPLKAIRKLGNSVNADYRPSLRKIISLTPWPMLVINGSMILIGVVGGIGATMVSFQSMMSNDFEPPCYVRPFLSISFNSVIRDITNCCGPDKNISIYGNPEQFCSVYASY